jgi:hypothetical protein
MVVTAPAMAIIFDSQYNKEMGFNTEAPILKNKREIM